MSPSVDGQDTMEIADVDLLLDGATIITVDALDRVIADGAIAIAGATIVDVGDAADVRRRWRPRQHIRLPNRIILPGFVNAHTHLAMTLFRGIADDVSLQGFLGRLLPMEARIVNPDRCQIASRVGAIEAILTGTTTVQDMYFFPDAALAAASEVGLRVVTGPVFVDGDAPDNLTFDERIDAAARWLQDRASDHLRVALAPHSLYALDPSRVRVVHELASSTGALIHIHASENPVEVAQVTAAFGHRPIELLSDLGVLDTPAVLAHCVSLDQSEVALIGRSIASVAHCPASNLKLASGIAPVPELRAAGATVALGTDGPASSNDLNPWHAMRLAALIHKAAQRDPTVINACEALRMATIDGARALRLDHAIGSLEVGKLADLVIVDGDRPHLTPAPDPVSALVYSAGRGDVTDVYVAGRRVVGDGRLRTATVDQSLIDLRRAATE